MRTIFQGLFLLVSLAAISPHGLAAGRTDQLDGLVLALGKMPDLSASQSAMPNPAQVIDLYSAALAVESETIKSAVEEYAAGTILLVRGYPAMQTSKMALGITRITEIESVCIKRCGCVKNAVRAVCGKCGGNGFVVDADCLRKMLAQYDKWLRNKTEALYIDKSRAPKISERYAKSMVRVEGSAAKCVGLIVERDGKRYVSAPVGILAANMGVELSCADGKAIPYGRILTTRSGVALFELTDHFPAVTMRNEVATLEETQPIWVYRVNSSDYSATCVDGVLRAGADGKLALEGISETTLSGSPVIMPDGSLLGMVSDVGSSCGVGGVGAPLGTRGGSIVRLDSLKYHKLSTLPMVEWRRQNAILVDLERKLLCVSNELAREEVLFGQSQDVVRPLKIVARCRDLANETAVGIPWCIPEMGGFADKLKGTAYNLAIRAAKLEELAEKSVSKSKR